MNDICLYYITIFLALDHAILVCTTLVLFGFTGLLGSATWIPYPRQCTHIPLIYCPPSWLNYLLFYLSLVPPLIVSLLPPPPLGSTTISSSKCFHYPLLYLDLLPSPLLGSKYLLYLALIPPPLIVSTTTSSN